MILALIGGLRLAGRRQWPILVGLLGLGPGVGAFLMLLAARGVFVSDRYFASMDVSIAFAAAFGLAALSAEVPAAIRRLGEQPRRRAAWLAPLGVAALAVVLTAGWGGLGSGLQTSIRGFLWMATDALKAQPALLAAVAAVPDARSWPAPGTPDPARPLLLVPKPLWPQLAVDLDLPLTHVGVTDPSAIDVAGGRPAVGQIVFHDRRADGTADGIPQLEPHGPTRFGTSIVVPLAADPERGYWIVRIDPAG